MENARAWLATETAYLELQSTKPQTIAAALSDSPAGLAARMGEKFWRWTDNQGAISDAIPLEGLLANLTTCWVTNTIGPCMRSYYESLRAEAAWGTPRVPLGYLMPARPLFPTPREWIERQGPVARWTETEAGGSRPGVGGAGGGRGGPPGLVEAIDGRAGEDFKARGRRPVGSPGIERLVG